MDLMTDQLIKISEGAYQGIYRVVAISPEEHFLAIVESSFQGLSKRGPKPKSNEFSDHPILKRTSSLLILNRKDIHQLISDLLLEKVEFRVSNRALIYMAEKKSADLNRDQTIRGKHQKNITLMQHFLDPTELQSYIIKDRGFSGLVRKTVRIAQCNERIIYRLLQKLIIFGFNENSLIPDYFKSGAPGIARPSRQGKKKAGRKTLPFKNAQLNGNKPPVDTPGMSELWKHKCLLALKKQKKPHPSVNKMYRFTLNDQFCTSIEMPNGEVISSELVEGTYPTLNQFKYLLKKLFNPIEHIKRRTTDFNFNQNHRGLLGRSYDGIAGPGHTFAIDSTIGDIYLVSSLDRSKIVGKPVIYLLNDVWSGAILGFYVCLSGPDWNSAKLAILSTAYDPEKMAELMGVTYVQVFRHKSGLPKTVLGDHGEYIAFKASISCFILEIDEDFTPPYRGDGKGITEVQFHTIKDEQASHATGAYDARRKEMELRKSNPMDATMTIHEFTGYLASHIREYNLSADMKHRLDDYMMAQGVTATPAGLWDWGHDIGIGYKRHVSDDELIRTLMLNVDAKSTMYGIKVNGRYYSDPTNKLDIKLAAIARNYGESDIDVWIYPGNIQKIWTNSGMDSGLREVPRSGTDSSFVTEQEYQDAVHYSRVVQLEDKHTRTKASVNEFSIRQQIVDESIRQTKTNNSSTPRSTKQDIKSNRTQEIDHQIPRENPEPASTEQNLSEDATATPDSYRNWIEKSLFGDGNG